MQHLHLTFKPQNIHGVYGINYYYTNSNGLENRLQFEAEVCYCGQYMDEYAIFHLTKSEFVVNRNESDEYLYDIAKKCASVIYPIAILVDNKGRIVYIQPPKREKEWVEMRAELVRYYKGSTVKDYLNKVENQLNSTDIYHKIVNTDMFFSQLFSIKYGENNVDLELNRGGEYVPFTLPMDLTFNQEVDCNLNDDAVNCFSIYHKGATTTEYKYGTVYNQQGLDSSLYHSKVSATIDMSYELDKKSFSVEAIEGDYIVKVNDKPFSIARIEAYRLHEKPIERRVDKDFQKMEQENLKKENSFSNSLKRYFNE